MRIQYVIMPHFKATEVVLFFFHIKFEFEFEFRVIAYMYIRRYLSIALVDMTLEK